MDALRIRILLCAAIMCAGLLPCAHAIGSEVAGRLLVEADAVRSSQPELFARLLRRLDLRSDLEPAQREHLQYLHAYAATYAGDYEQSIARATPLAEHAADLDIRVRAGSLLVNSYTIQRRFADGLRQLDRTLAISDQAREPSVRDHALHVAAMLHNAIGQYRTGERFAGQVLAQADVAPRTRCFTSELKYEAMFNLQTLPADEAPLRGAIEQCVAVREPVVANFIRGILARKLAKDGERTEAIRLLQDAMPEIQATRFPNLIGQMHSLLGELLSADGKTAQAERHAQTAVGYAGEIERSTSLIAAYRTLYEIAEQRGDMDSALRYYKLFAKADVDFVNEANAREMAYQLVRQESETKSQQIALLNRQNEVLKLQQQIDRQSAENMKVLAGLALLLLGAIGYWAWRVKRMEQALRQQTEIDGLTGVASRQYFCSETERLLERAGDRGTSAAILMFDLDHFKHFNDRHGHDTGDWVLRRAAQACRAACRRGDLVGRLGGEEFAILLLDIGRDGALRVAEACRAAVAAVGAERGDLLLQPSASFGIALTRVSGYDFTQLLSHADKALYQAKHDGRDRVRLYDATSPAEPEGGAGARQAGLRLAHSGPGTGGRTPPL